MNCNRLTVSWSINTLDEAFKDNMDTGVSIERRIVAMKKVYDTGIRTVTFISPVFPGITDIEAIIERTKDQCDDLSPVEIDAIRQTKATLAIEQLQLNEEGLSEIESLVKGDISREEFQRKLKEKYQTHEER